MHFTIGLKIFGIAVGLLILMAAVALLSMRMTRIVDDQLVIIDRNYFPTSMSRSLIRSTLTTMSRWRGSMSGLSRCRRSGVATRGS